MQVPVGAQAWPGLGAGVVVPPVAGRAGVS